MAMYAGSDIFVELLIANGVENIFYNPGFDVVPLLSAVVRYKGSGKPAPKPIMCLDEFTALNAAHGNYMVSGRPQVLLVHSELGTQQVGGAIQQAWYGKVPVIICAADMVAPGRLNWKGESYDQGMMLRNCVKWDHKVGAGESFYDILRQAFQIALSQPSGPVYLTYSLEAISKKVEITEIQKSEILRLPIPSQSLLEKAADILIEAENPLIMTGHSGRNLETVPRLVELAELLGARVVTSPIRMNFPSDHPLCANIEPSDGMQHKPYFLSSDAVLVIDYDIPYAYPRTQPKAETKLIHIDIDFVKQGEILWNRTPDISIKAESVDIIPVLTELIGRKLNSEQRLKINRRAAKIEIEHRQIRGDWKSQGLSAAHQNPISAEWLVYCINQAIDRDTIVVNQTITPSSSVTRQLPRSQPGTLLACAGGTIGWALGATLGAKLAAPDKMVVGLMGDGAFVYGGPTAALWPADYYKVPFLTVIFNNQAYGAIKGLFRGDWKEGIETSTITPSPSYELTAQACGGYGKIVDKPEDVLPALKEASQKVRDGQAAVLDVRIG